MCEYCESNKKIDFYFAELWIDDNDLLLDDGGQVMSTPISYCPMCGQKLEVLDDTE